jgi:hypothetical protein
MPSQALSSKALSEEIFSRCSHNKKEREKLTVFIEFARKTSPFRAWM